MAATARQPGGAIGACTGMMRRSLPAAFPQSMDSLLRVLIAHNHETLRDGLVRHAGRRGRLDER